MKQEAILFDEIGQETLFSGEAEVTWLENGGCVVKMKSDIVHMIWKILSKGLIIENSGELQVILSLMDKGTGKARIFSPYGEMSAPLEQVYVEKQPPFVRAAYEMPDGSPFSFRLETDWNKQAEPAEME